MLKTTLRLLLRWLFRFRAYGEAVLASPGPVLLVPNHVSWVDWLFLGVCLDEDWKFVVSRETSERSWLHRKLMINRRTFPLDTTSSYAVKRMAEYLEGNGRLVLFPEGRLSRMGCLMKLFDGTGFLLHKVGAKVITCYLRGAHRLPLSPNPNAKRWFPTVTAHFSELLTPPRLEHVSTTQGRTRLTNWLLDSMVRQQFETEMAFGPSTVADAIVETAAMRPGQEALRDLTSALTYRRLVVGARLLRDQLKAALEPGSQGVGVLLPNLNALPVVLLALWSLGRTPAMLNFSTGPTLMLACARLAGLKEIVTSHTFLERAKLSLESLAGSIEWKLQPVEGVPEGGRLLVRGANVMRGYLNPEANAKFKELGGWYDTGDLARVDEDNFLFILGRLKRFAKVSGEMVSLTAVEDALAGAFPKYGLRCLVAVLSRPDEDKGEMLIAVSNEPRLQLDGIRSAIRANGFPNICVPREVEYVHEIPKLGTGKVDYRKLQGLLH